MTILSKRKFGFRTSSVYLRREPHAFKYLSERATFWIAIFSVFAFVTGNMIGQNGWNVFWKSVLGEGSENTIVFTGMVPPVAEVPDQERWSKVGGNIRVNTFRQVPRDLLIPLPTYIHHGNDLTADQNLRRVYFVEHLGTYENGRGLGSHVGVDISLPEGTPIQSIANGIVVKVDYDAGGYGNYVVMKNPNVPNVERLGAVSSIYSIYAHLQTALVHEGEVIQKGEQIALSGKTGNATAPHLHFQIDRGDAPYHPYWPFTTADERQAKMSFTQAIDAGLGRANGVAYTLDPMLTVQSYLSYTAPATAVATASSISSSASSLSSPLARADTVTQRRLQRLAKLPMPAAKPTLVAFNDDPASESSSSSSAAQTGAGAVAGIRFAHSGSFSRDRGWQTLTLTLLDASGNVIQSPVDSADKLYLSTAYGHAEFHPAVVSLADFRNGILRVQILPTGQTTVIVQVQPLRSVSAPMKFVR